MINGGWALPYLTPDKLPAVGQDAAGHARGKASYTGSHGDTDEGAPHRRPHTTDSKKYRLNTEDPQIMHIDLNSAFASAEQQAWPSLRGRPMGVTNRLSPECCVIAASYEAKALGVKVGVRRSEAMALCPEFIMLETDPSKYTFMYQNLMRIMKSYSPDIKMKSIDEGIIDFHGTRLVNKRSLRDIGLEIKQRMRDEVGKFMRVNIGIGPNRFLAKTAAGLHKPDGLDVIDHTNLIDIYRGMELTDLTGIAEAYGARLKAHGINTPLQFLEASDDLLRRRVFKSINGLHWHERLRGYEVDDYVTQLSMVGRQWVVRKPSAGDEFLRSCLHYLAETVGMKLRYRNVEARGVCVWVGFTAGGGWRDKVMLHQTIYTNQDIWLQVSRLFDRRPKHMIVNIMGVYLYELTPSTRSQLSMFDDVEKADYLCQAMDEINDFYGQFTVYSADTLTGTQNVQQKIPFGGTEYFDLLLKRA
jgi:DNA polymerase-4